LAAIVAGLRAVSVAAGCSTIIIIILFSDFRLAGYLEEEEFFAFAIHAVGETRWFD
jgi:hypothetical protein